MMCRIRPLLLLPVQLCLDLILDPALRISFAHPGSWCEGGEDLPVVITALRLGAGGAANLGKRDMVLIHEGESDHDLLMSTVQV